MALSPTHTAMRSWVHAATSASPSLCQNTPSPLFASGQLSSPVACKATQPTGDTTHPHSREEQVEGLPGAGCPQGARCEHGCLCPALLAAASHPVGEVRLRQLAGLHLITQAIQKANGPHRISVLLGRQLWAPLLQLGQLRHSIILLLLLLPPILILLPPILILLLSLLRRLLGRLLLGLLLCLLLLQGLSLFWRSWRLALRARCALQPLQPKHGGVWMGWFSAEARSWQRRQAQPRQAAHWVPAGKAGSSSWRAQGAAQPTHLLTAGGHGHVRCLQLPLLRRLGLLWLLHGRAGLLGQGL